MADSPDQSSTYFDGETITVFTTLPESPSTPHTSSIGTEQHTQPVATTDDSPSTDVASPLPRESFWGLSPRDCLLLMVLSVVCLLLSFWHWLQLSNWGLEPVEVERLPERVYDYRIDINQATWVEWMQLPGVGQTLAQRIIDYRTEHGPFESVEDLDDIKGIGPKTLEKLRPWLIVREPAEEKPQTNTTEQ